MALKFNTDFEPHYGQAVPAGPGVLRLTVENPSPFTFHGTNSYIVGERELAVIDPGPEDEAHLNTLLRVIDGRPVSHIFVSHTHRDHSPLAARLAAETGALICGEGPQRYSRPMRPGEVNPMQESSDTDFMPGLTMMDGDRIEGDGWTLGCVLTPGHAANHACFSLEGTGILFSADHVMGWSTSIVAPPDGSMADYMASLDKLLERDDRIYLPGHGGPVTKPAPFVRGLRTHRKMRERAILERIRAGDRTIPEMVAAIYRDTDPRLHGAAGLSVLAHIEDLVGKGAVRADGEVSLAASYAPA
jgi:glyoxylase-like metal-dependent hydrolase (beta-lactamase superfamily II)